MGDLSLWGCSPKVRTLGRTPRTHRAAYVATSMHEGLGSGSDEQEGEISPTRVRVGASAGEAERCAHRALRALRNAALGVTLLACRPGLGVRPLARSLGLWRWLAP